MGTGAPKPVGGGFEVPLAGFTLLGRGTVGNLKLFSHHGPDWKGLGKVFPGVGKKGFSRGGERAQ